MDTHELIDRLSILTNIDYEAIRRYDLTVFDIDDPDVLEQMELFRQDHEYHIRDYTDIIERIMGSMQEPRDKEKDLSDQASVTIQPGTGMRGALETLEGAEKTINTVYSEAVSEDYPADIKEIIERNYADERRHLEYIQKILQTEAAA